MRISDWSSDVCSSDLHDLLVDSASPKLTEHDETDASPIDCLSCGLHAGRARGSAIRRGRYDAPARTRRAIRAHSPASGSLDAGAGPRRAGSSEEQTYELQSLMRNSYAVF